MNPPAPDAGATPAPVSKTRERVLFGGELLVFTAFEFLWGVCLGHLVDRLHQWLLPLPRSSADMPAHRALYAFEVAPFAALLAALYVLSQVAVRTLYDAWYRLSRRVDDVSQAFWHLENIQVGFAGRRATDRRRSRGAGMVMGIGMSSNVLAQKTAYMLGTREEPPIVLQSCPTNAKKLY